MTIDELLKPVSGTAPCGEDLSFSSEFDELAHMRRQDDPTLDQGEWKTALKVADWPGAKRRCGELLAQRSKDLRLAMWWAEAATLTDGYAGLHEGLLLLGQLCDRYWDGLHPVAEGGDVEQRVGNIGWFLGRLPALAITPAVAQGRGAGHSLQQLAVARALQAGFDRSPDKPVPPDAFTLDKFNRAVRETPKDHLRQSVASLEACLQAFKAWQATLDARLGAEGPAFSAARESLESALHEVQRLAREAGALGDTAAAAPSASTTSTAEAASVPGAPALSGPLRSREQALAQLRDVATFFRTTEPHSPVAYLAEKAVQWGDMPLHVWLRSVLKDPGALAHVEELLGLQPREDGPAG